MRVKKTLFPKTGNDDILKISTNIKNFIVKMQDDKRQGNKRQCENHQQHKKGMPETMSGTKKYFNRNRNVCKKRKN